MIKMILAMTKSGVIGLNGKMPWHIPSELRHFRDQTIGHDVLMGRKTFDSFEGKLANRKNIVLSSKKVNNADMWVSNHKEVVEMFEQYTNKDLFIIGGKSLFEKYLQYAEEVILSVIKQDYIGDTIVSLDFSNFNKEILFETPDYIVWKYKRKKAQ